MLQFSRFYKFFLNTVLRKLFKHVRVNEKFEFSKNAFTIHKQIFSQFLYSAIRNEGL